MRNLQTIGINRVEKAKTKLAFFGVFCVIRCLCGVHVVLEFNSNNEYEHF